MFLSSDLIFLILPSALWCLTTQNKIIFLPAVSSSFPFHGSTAKSPPIADYICVSSIVLTFGLRGQLRSGRCHQIWQGIIINTSHFRQSLACIARKWSPVSIQNVVERRKLEKMSLGLVGLTFHSLIFIKIMEILYHLSEKWPWIS